MKQGLSVLPAQVCLRYVVKVVTHTLAKALVKFALRATIVLKVQLNLKHAARGPFPSKDLVSVPLAHQVITVSLNRQ